MQDAPPPPPIVLVDQAAHTLPDARPRGEQLWIPEEQVHAVTGFEWKPEGLCLAERCLPVPAGADWVASTPEEEGGGRWLELTGFADHQGQAWVVDEAHSLWSFATAPARRALSLEEGLAPDFELSAVDGERVRLSDFRGRKVLLWTWASW